ncbi:MAG TPA: methyltransferase domain-containing protein [Casimicrobiaceae bacterium]|nr:methyltransferase domain-containing protein [Casimicrobiaceae bacterium]
MAQAFRAGERGLTMIYERVFDAANDDSLARIARWVCPGTMVLELGSAGGHFTAFLATRAKAVDIVEIDAEAAARAGRHARRAVVADLESDGWLAELGDARYDTIVCADVLEHVRGGERLLLRLRSLLVPEGELLLSVPNVAHNAIVANLVDQRFDYGAEGLLDAAHVKLYTWRSLADLLKRTGFGIREWDATTLAEFDTEFRVRSESWPEPLRGLLANRPHGHVYQWLVRAGADGKDEQLEPPRVGAHATLPVRLLYASDIEALSLDTSVTVDVPLDTDAVDVEWRLPRPASKLRLLLADRIGVMRMASCHVWRGDELLWSLDADAVDLATTVVRLDTHTFALTAPDGWLAPSPAAPLATDRMTATLAWMGRVTEADSFGVLSGLARAYRDHVASGAQERHELLAQCEEHAGLRAEEANAHAKFRAQVQQLERSMAQRDADVIRLEHAVAAYKAENARLDAALAAQDRIISYRQSARWWLRLPFVRVKLLWHRLTRV